ncbi:hypothetical protein EDB89DRAFT_684057 [Lactarius sanguifluus]|nr:hypothetical protein EDB89DRAFT_684057 [Lactarius sanguifluus]
MKQTHLLHISFLPYVTLQTGRARRHGGESMMTRNGLRPVSVSADCALRSRGHACHESACDLRPNCDILTDCRIHRQYIVNALLRVTVCSVVHVAEINRIQDIGGVNGVLSIVKCDKRLGTIHVDWKPHPPGPFIYPSQQKDR